MPSSTGKSASHSLCAAVLTIVGLGVGSATAFAASPEDEIARLNRVRANLFEELIKTRAEAAAARAELDAAIKAREQAEAELSGLRQNAAPSTPPRPAPASQPMVEPQTRVEASPPKPQSRTKASPGHRNPSSSRNVATAARPSTAPSRSRQVKLTRPKPAVSAARPQELPSVLQLQDRQ
jgi:hypothetical protein